MKARLIFLWLLIDFFDKQVNEAKKELNNGKYENRTSF